MKKIITLIAFVVLSAMTFEASGQDQYYTADFLSYEGDYNVRMHSMMPTISQLSRTDTKKSRRSSGVFDLASPDGKLQLVFYDILKRKRRSLAYSQYRTEVTIKYNFVDPVTTKKMVNVIAENARFEFTVKDGFKRREFGKGKFIDFKKNVDPISLPEETDERLKLFTGTFNVYVIEMENGISLEIRVYDMGVAYRYIVKNQPDEYKIVDVGPIFPHECPIAILGTFSGDYVMPWRTMIVDPELCKIRMIAKDENRDDVIVDAMSYIHTYGEINDQDGLKLLNKNEYTQNDFHKAKIVPWRDALSFAFVGASFDQFCGGNRWGEVINGFSSVNLTYIYKYLYFGLGFTPCHEFLYISYDKQQPPFDRVAGPIHEWNLTGRVGFNLPVQSGYGLWNFSSYLSTSTMRLSQHKYSHPHFAPLEIRRRNLIGGGVNLSYAFQEGWALSIGYELRAFTAPDSPIGIHSLHLGLGYKF